MEKIRIAVAEDNPRLARSIRETLEVFDQVELLFVASNGQEMIHKLSSALPDLVLMDINMPVLDGIEATKKIRHLFPQVKIVMLTIFDETEKIFDAILAGAGGYLLKDEKPEKLIAAIEEAMEGGAPMSASIAAKSLQLIRGKNTEAVSKKEFNLSARELEILELLAKGENYNQIAEKLFISPKTVRKHIENIYTKLQVHNKVEAIQVATKNKLLSLFF
jgi:DNA-binding NarL/FixJ family response regulator